LGTQQIATGKESFRSLQGDIRHLKLRDGTLKK
jgi:hypothetical protein